MVSRKEGFPRPQNLHQQEKGAESPAIVKTENIHTARPSIMVGTAVQTIPKKYNLDHLGNLSIAYTTASQDPEFQMIAYFKNTPVGWLYPS